MTLVACLPSDVFAQAQTGSINGRVLNQGTQEYLRNVVVKVVGTNIGTTAEAGGNYSLSNVPAGEAKLSFTYAGLDAQEVVVTILAGQTITKNVVLTSTDYDSDVIHVGAFVVSSEREGNAKAIMEQRQSLNMKNVVASDAFGTVSEGNVGEFLKLMPGVSIDYAEADARSIRLRGLDPKYTSVLMDGMPVASAGSSDIASGRKFELEQLSIASIETVELTKTPQPSDNASALAGVVNLRSKGALDRKGRRISMDATVAFNSLDPGLKKTPGPNDNTSYKLMPNITLEYSDVYLKGKLGVLAGFNHAYTFAEQKAETVTYAARDTNPNNNDTEQLKVDNFQFRDSPKPTKRQNYNIRVDYVFSPEFSVWGRVDYNTYSAKFFSRDLRVNFGTADTTTSPYSLSSQTTQPGQGGTQFLGAGGATNKYGDTATISSGIRYNKGQLQADFSGQYSAATNHYVDIEDGFFWAMQTSTLGSLRLRFDRNGPADPGVQITQLSGPDWRSLSNYTLGTFAKYGRASKDQKYTGRGDFSYALDEWRIPVKAKWGVSINENVRNVERSYNNATYTYVGGAGAPSNNAANFAEPNYRMYFDWGTNLDGLTNIDRFGPARMLGTNPERFTGPTPAQHLYIYQYDYDYKEQIDAAYLQTVFKVADKLHIAPGVRFEKTTSWGRGPDDVGDLEARRRLTGPVVTTSAAYQTARYGQKRSKGSDYDNVFKYLHISYELMANLLVRASYNDAITRADIANLIPGISNVNETAIPPTANVNNPDLKPELSRNLNASVEYYFSGVGMIGATVFRSDIKDLQRRIPIDVGAEGLDGDVSYAGYRIRQWTNVAKAHLTGFELNYSQQLKFLPSILQNISVFANHTHVRFDTWDNFLESPKNTANVGIAYRKSRLGFQLNANWTGFKMIAAPPAAGAANAGWASYERERFMCDFNIDFEIMRGASFFISGRNIFNEPLITYIGRSDIATRWAQYGGIWTTGVKARF